MADVPFNVCVERANVAIKAGFTIFQKFTCAHCGARQTINSPNAMHTQGICEECGQTTNITQCGFAAMIGVPGGNTRHDGD